MEHIWLSLSINRVSGVDDNGPDKRRDSGAVIRATHKGLRYRDSSQVSTRQSPHEIGPSLITTSELRQRSEETYLQLPVHTLYKVGDKERSPKTAFLFSLQLALYRESLLNKFLLDRLPGYGSYETKQSLIETARKMLDAILLLAANRDELTDFTMGFVWAVGLPSPPRAVK